jgi:hypothetical protein
MRFISWSESSVILNFRVPSNKVYTPFVLNVKLASFVLAVYRFEKPATKAQREESPRRRRRRGDFHTKPAILAGKELFYYSTIGRHLL